MIFGKNRILIIPRICVVVCMPVLLSSCVAPLKKEEPPINNRLLAESSLIKKRLPLIERENDILKKENLQLRTRIKDLEFEIEKSESQLADLTEKYTNDMAAGDLQIEDLQARIQILEKESVEKIAALESQNDALEKKLNQYVKALSVKIVAQKKMFDQEREEIIQKSAKKESELMNQLNELKKEMDKRDSKILSLKMAISEISVKFVEASAQAEASKKSQEKAIAELESVKATNTALTNKLKALYHEPPTQNRTSSNPANQEK